MALLLLLSFTLGAEESAHPPGTNDFAKPLSLADALNLALHQNAAVQKAQTDLNAAYGVIVQTRAIALPKLRAAGNFQANDPNAVEQFPFTAPPGFGAVRVEQPDQTWSASLRIVQSIYEGGRINSALRTAKLTKEQALANYQTVAADTILGVRTAYDDALLARQQISVQEASTQLLQRELEDTQRRLDAGTVPQFNVLRADVELANVRPKLIRARNAYRIAKNNLANLLGYNLPREMGEDIPLQLSGALEAEPFEVQLSDAILRALAQRSELSALRSAEKLRAESIVNAHGGYKPSVQLFAGYGSRNSTFSSDLSRDVSGWFTGAQATWDIFDGGLTRGRIAEAEALRDRARIDIADTERRIELEVRTAFSNLIEAREVIESQRKVQEQATEALRLAQARAEAGTATQLDVLGAQTALTEARSTQIQALHDYSVARARLERALGGKFEIEFKK